MNDNIFSGLKVVDFASFIAGPSAAVSAGNCWRKRWRAGGNSECIHWSV
jgi:hypothetical protein